MKASEFYYKLKLNFFLKELIAFIIIIAVGVFASMKLGKIIKLIPEDFKVRKPSFAELLVFFIFGFLFFYSLFSRSKFGGYFLKIFYLLAVFFGIQLILSLFINNFFASTLAILLITLNFLYPSIFFHNLNFAFAICGLSVVLAVQITPITAVIILVFFSVYDIIAVYFTRHMVKMAQSMIEKKVIFGFIVPAKTSYLIHPPEKFKMGRPESEVVVLGGGDIAMPLILVLSLVRVGIWQTVLVAIFALFGLFFTHLIFNLQRERKPMAALPPIATVTILGYLLTFIF